MEADVPDNDTDALPWSPSEALATLRRMGDRPAVLSVADGKADTVTGAELHARTLGAVATLTEAGVGHGSVVALWAPNSPAWIAAALACHHLGTILAPIDSLLPVEEAREQILASGAERLLVEGDAAEAFADRIACLDLDALPLHDGETPAATVGPGDPIALFRTSGTTGVPKAFHLSLRNIGWNVRAIAATGLVSPGDRVLLPLPMHHVFPWITATLTCLTVGAPIILPEGLTGPQIAEALRLGKPTVLVGVPRLFEAIVSGIRDRLRTKGRLAAAAFDGWFGLAKALQKSTNGRLGSALMSPVRKAIAPDLRLLVSGGAHLPLPVQQSLEALGWDVRVGYGLAETAASVAGTLVTKRAGTVGQPIAGCEIRIDQPGADGTGEILLRGPVVFAGYIDNPEANAEAFTADGFFRTGDLGRLDSDGFLTITGRKKEVIVLAGGDNLFPEDVEKEYLADPQIAEIGVMERNGALVALIVPNLAEIAKAGATQAEDAIRIALGEVAKRLPSTWRLAGFTLTRESLPRTRLGKLRRFQLPDLYDRAKSGATGARTRALTADEKAWIAEPRRAAVWAILARDHGAQPFDLDSHLQLDLGLDSFGWMTLGVAIEEATGVRLDETDMAAIGTVRDLLTRVTEKAEAGEIAGPAQAEQLTAERERWLSPPTTWERLLNRLLHPVNAGLMRLAFRLTVKGAETLPASGPLLVCPNHVSDMDALVLAAALPPPMRRRATWAAVRGRVFGTRLRAALARAARAFPVDETAPMVAVDLTVEALKGGAVQVWFPEGWRSPDGKLLPFQAGIGEVVLRSGATVVPVLIAGTYEAWPRDRRLPRLATVAVTFGPPVTADRLLAEAPEGPNRPKAIADAIHARVAELAAAREFGSRAIPDGTD